MQRGPSTNQIATQFFWQIVGHLVLWCRPSISNHYKAINHMHYKNNCQVVFKD